MNKNKIISFILITVFIFSLISCGNDSSVGKDWIHLGVGGSTIIEVNDYGEEEKEDYSRVELTVLDISGEYFTVKIELLELKIGDEGIAIYI